jgi:hypothetical protein
LYPNAYGRSWRNRPQLGLGATLKANVYAKFQYWRNVFTRGTVIRVNALEWRIAHCSREVDLGFGRGVLFWLLGVPIPIIILLALFWHH